MMRTVFFGTASFAIRSLEQLVARGHHVLACVTQPDRPQGRGLRVLPSPVKTAALRLGLRVEEPSDLQGALAELQRLQPDVGIVISYGRLIPGGMLEWPRHGMLGVHPSLLPRYRGASPLAWTILNADETTGATVFRLNERLDAGDTLLQRVVPTNPQDTAEGLSERLAQLGAALLLEALERLETNQASFTPQDEAGATYAPKLTKAQGRIDWRAPAAAIDRVVRATIPWPGASTDWHGQSLKLWATSFDSHNHGKPGEPGTVLSATAEGIVVATGEGKLRIRELQLAGRRRMGVGEFLSGHPLHVGDILGSGQ